MVGAAAVLFTITIPKAAEEQRLKNVYLARQSKATETITTTTTTKATVADTQSLKTLKLCEEEEAPVMTQMTSSPASSLDAFSKRRKSAPLIDIQLEKSEKSESADQLEQPKPEAFDLLTVDSAMEQVLREILRKFQIVNAVWLSNLENNMYHITFTVEFNELYENLYEALQEWGIGDREGSTVSVMNCIASKSYSRSEECDEQLGNNESSDNINAQSGAWTRFMNSVRSRLNVAQIVRDVRQDAAINFDFCILLVSAAVLASFGLVENSTIFLASSMLISPLMGPIIAAIFGTVIRERTLRLQGMRNELVGILLATLVGFLFGLVVCTTDSKYGIGEGLTEEMLARCDLHSLVVGVFTAIPSGAAAAIGILGGNIGSLVGVAISASLLPPAVNAGLLWALACIYKYFESDDSRYLYVVKSRMYSENQAAELAILGSISMCLTLSNVLCVYVMGILVLKVKEIAPVIARNNSHFWKHDIKLARVRAKHGMVSTDAAIFDEFANLPKEDQQALGMNCNDFLRNLEEDEVAYQHTWSPLSNRHTFVPPQQRDNYSTIHRLEKLYTTISSPSERERGLIRRPIQRTSDLANQLYLLDPRPRFATMPSNANRDLPHVMIKVPEESAVRRFTVTPAAEDPLLK